MNITEILFTVGAIILAIGMVVVSAIIEKDDGDNPYEWWGDDDDYY